MNKRQRKKLLKQELIAIEKEFSFCQDCGQELDLKNNEYHKKYAMCNSTCYMNFIGMSWSDFI